MIYIINHHAKILLIFQFSKWIIFQLLWWVIFGLLFTGFKCTKEISGTGELNYEHAKQYAEKHGLLNDFFVQEILELRHDNPIYSHHMNVEISHDFNDIIDASAKMSIVAAFKMNGSYKQDLRTRKVFKIDQDIVFN